MKKLFLLSVLFTIVAIAVAQRNTAPKRTSVWHNNIVPKPVSLTRGEGFFTLPYELSILITKNEELKKIAVQLSQQLNTASNKITITESKTAATNAIFLSLTNDNSIPAEGYRLKVSDSGIIIAAKAPAGIFYGVQTLLQLLPSAIESKEKQKPVDEWNVPVITIEDAPRFGWRGLMLDVSRHFFTVAEVKDYIDQMAKYKFNLLHLHLTDDQGWRIQIKSLPRLTEVGAWRVDKTGTFGRLSKPEPNEPKTYGGFYTQEDIKELVKYAGEKYISILPEIDMPGHSLAALASYPELTCTPGTYAVNSGEQFMIWPGGGQHFYGTLDNTLCPANEKVYDFLDKVFTEVAELFPFAYIHMGGDETARNFWEKSNAIKTLMKKEHLKNLDEVQSYFVKRVEKIIASKGKKMIGWDEILQGGLAPNAAVMNWRGIKDGIEAARQGHDIVMTPTEFCYIDYMQGDASIEPPVYASLRLKKAYQFEPVPDGIDAKFVKGGQANLWTEQVYNMRHAQYMTWPRAFAIAEVLWSPKEKRDWNDFVQRVEGQFKRLDVAEVKYAPSMYDPVFNVSKKDTSTIIVALSTEVEGLKIHYSFDNSFPDNFYPAYTTPLTVPKDASFMKLITYRDNKPIGRMIVIPVTELKKRAGIK
ncbi:beta-N-acetylhexosaminidase [Ferruginibacter sp. SUN106]|uniref:beta-N-acetylhexosaminidase n=1 Tax=Ferruginibacter sp. SUN106 TaxID=2978348 RepID=UPI003D36C3EB